MINSDLCQFSSQPLSVSDRGVHSTYSGFSEKLLCKYVGDPSGFDTTWSLLFSGLVGRHNRKLNERIGRPHFSQK